MVRALPGCTASRPSIGRARGRGGGRLPLPNPRSSLANAPHGAEQYDSAYCQTLHPFGRICKGAESDSEAGSEGTQGSAVPVLRLPADLISSDPGQREGREY